MKIYTKTGDKGETSLVGGKRVKKYDLRLETCGTIDELNSFTGLLRDGILEQHKPFLLMIQQELFTLEALVASTAGSSMQLAKIGDEVIIAIEKEIDRLSEGLPELTHFILPGGHETVSYCHVCRTICRRAERLLVRLADETMVPGNELVFVNRLSDYFFVLSRRVGKDLGVEELIWTSPKK